MNSTADGDREGLTYGHNGTFQTAMDDVHHLVIRQRVGY